MQAQSQLGHTVDMRDLMQILSFLLLWLLSEEGNQGLLDLVHLGFMERIWRVMDGDDECFCFLSILSVVTFRGPSLHTCLHLWDRKSPPLPAKLVRALAVISLWVNFYWKNLLILAFPPIILRIRGILWAVSTIINEELNARSKDANVLWFCKAGTRRFPCGDAVGMCFLVCYLAWVPVHYLLSYHHNQT